MDLCLFPLGGNPYHTGGNALTLYFHWVEMRLKCSSIDAHLPFRFFVYIDMQIAVHIDIHIAIHIDIHIDMHIDIHMDIHVDIHIDIHGHGFEAPGMDLELQAWI